MPHDAPEPTPETEGQSTRHLVHVLLRFGLSVRQRLHVFLFALAGCGLLAGLYYATATRHYSAKAELLVIQAGEAGMSPTMTAQGGTQDSLMPTFEGLLSSAKVLDGALAMLAPEDRQVDLTGLDNAKAVAALRKNLTIRAGRNTNILSIECRSKDPGTAVRVVSAVVASYLAFMQRTHQGTASDIARILTVEKEDLARKLKDVTALRRELRLSTRLAGSQRLKDSAVCPHIEARASGTPW